MTLINPAKDFFVKAVMHAKHGRINELNSLESELMILEDNLISLKEKGIKSNHIDELSVKIDEMKKTIRRTKNQVL